MKLLKRHYAKPYFISEFCNSFVQMGLFIFFLRWLSNSYDGSAFFWRSLLIQLALFMPALFMMPLASYFAGHYPKGKVMAASALGMGLSVLTVAILFYNDCHWVAFGITALYGIFQAVYTPAKLGAIKEIFGDKHLAQANAIQITVYVLGILSVSCLTVGLVPGESTPIPYKALPFIYAGTTFLGALSACFIRMGRYTTLKYRSPIRVFTATWSNPIIRLSIWCLALYWGISQLFLILSQDFTGTTAATFFQPTMILTAAGYIVGAFVAARASKHFVETGLIPFTMFASAVLMFILPFVNIVWIRVLLYAILGAFSGSSFVVLRSVIQHFTKPDTSGRIHAVSEMIQMGVLTLLLGAQCLLFTFTSVETHQVFLVLAAFLAICFKICLNKTPLALLRMVLRALFGFVFRYRIKIVGVNNIPESGPVLLVGSHYSFIDWAVLQMASPRPLIMASNRNKSDIQIQSILERLKKYIPISRRDPAPAMQQIHDALLAGEAIVIFPEGEVSKTPNISRFSINYASAIEGTNATIVPFYIQGLWAGPYSHFSDSIMMQQATTRIVSVGFGSAIPATTPEEEIRDRIRDLSLDTWDKAMDNYRPLISAWFAAMGRVRTKSIILDPAGNHVSGYQMISLVKKFSKSIRKETKKSTHVGYLLPTSREGVLSFLSILAAGKVSVNLNYTSPVDVVLGCIGRTGLTHVVTSHAFYEKLCSKNPQFGKIALVAELIFIDDLEKGITTFDWIWSAFVFTVVPRRLLEKYWFTIGHINDTAAVLFSSGSEGTPKGICLSHKNIVSNIQQFDSVIRLKRSDVVMAELPMFHSFGLTMSVLSPITDGVPIVPCPEPTDIKTLARSCAEFKATVLMGTPTFLRAFSVNRWVHPMCLDYIRFVISGAEKLRQEMRDSFRLKFGKEIFEAYGCTETAPLATINAPNVLLDDFLTMERCNDTTSVGQPIPGTRIVIADPETNEFLPQGEEGMVLISGPNVMQGYLHDEAKTSQVVIKKNGHRWYKTGDKGKLTPEGFLVLLDRYSRFAKLGGEMISLTAVEARITDTRLLEGHEFMTVAVPDSVKGERIVLMFVAEDKDPDEILKALRKSGIPPLMLPGSAFKVEKLPKLGSGKWDFTNLKRMAIELFNQR